MTYKPPRTFRVCLTLPKLGESAENRQSSNSLCGNKGAQSGQRNISTESSLIPPHKLHTYTNSILLKQRRKRKEFNYLPQTTRNGLFQDGYIPGNYSWTRATIKSTRSSTVLKHTRKLQNSIFEESFSEKKKSVTYRQ